MAADEHLNPNQIVFTKHEQKSVATGGSTTWRAHRGTWKVAQMQVFHNKPFHEEFSTPRGMSPQGTPESARYWHEGYESIGQPTPMFGAWGESSPAHHAVDSLFTTQSARVHAPVMLAMAENQAYKETGRGLVPPGDLSPHSARMVQHLQGLGAVSSDAPTDVTNTYSWAKPRTDDPHDVGWQTGPAPRKIVGPEELAAGKRTVKAVLRAGRGQRRTNRSEQLRLFS